MNAATQRAQQLGWAFAKFERFAGLVDIVPKSGPRIKLVLNEIQRAYCKVRTSRDVVLKPRQVGFTTLEQARDVWHFLTVPGARVVATCQSISDHAPLRLLSKNYDVMFESLQALGLKLNFRSRSNAEWTLADRDASLRIVEAGASEAAAAKKGRSGTISRLHLTETAFYEYAEETLNALLECVPGPEHGTEIVSESTANGAGGTFFDQYTAAAAGSSGYKAHFFPWFMQGEYALPLDGDESTTPQTDTERGLVAQHDVSPEQLKWYQRKLGEKKRQDLLDQEYPSDPTTCFLVAGRLFFDRERTIALRLKAREPIATELGGALRVWARPVKGERYLISADPSEGTGGDPGAALVYSRATGEHVATLHGQFPPGKLAELLDALGRTYNGALLIVERNNHGHAVLLALASPPEGRAAYQWIYTAPDGKPGWLNNEVSRVSMLDGFEDAHRSGRWETPDARVLGELLTFTVNANGKAEAQRGAHDDLVIAAGIGAEFCRRLSLRGPNRGVAETPLMPFG